MNKSKKTEGFWQEFCEVSGVNPNTHYEAWSFGNTSDMANRLLQLVLDGTKQATSSLVWEYENDSDPLPTLDIYDLVFDADEKPKAVLQRVAIRVLPFNEVDAQFAFDEGEGDRSLEYWRRVHWDFFSGVCEDIGRTPEKTMPICCVKFKLVYQQNAIE